MSQEEEERTHDFREGEKVAQISLVSMVFLTIIKGYTGLVYASVALLADAVNSLSDIFASALVWSGLRLAGKEPTERFPYGYYRGESLASLVVSAMIIFSGIEIIYESVNRFFSPVSLVDGTIPLLAAGISAVTYFILAKYKYKIGTQIGSKSLIADAGHSRVDVYAGVLVFIGIALSVFGLAEAEVIAAVLVALYIIKEGFEIGRDSVLSLMDASPDQEKIDKIKELAQEVPGVLDIHAIRLRRAGPVYFADAHITVIRDTSIEEAHGLSSIIEEKMKEAIPNLESATIHVEPEKLEKIRVAIPVDSEEGMSSKVVGHFGSVPFFAIADLENRDVSKLHFIENPGHDADKKRGVLAIDALVNENVDAVVVGEIGQGPFDMLRGHFITLYRLPSTDIKLEEVFSNLIHNELVKMDHP